MKIRRLDSRTADFRSRLAGLSAFESPDVESAARAIVEDVRVRGDRAVVELTNRLDERHVSDCAELEVPPERAARALAGLDRGVRTALETAAGRIRSFHERQRAESWSRTEDDGTRLGQRVLPLDRAGIYVPGAAPPIRPRC